MWHLVRSLLFDMLSRLPHVHVRPALEILEPAEMHAKARHFCEPIMKDLDDPISKADHDRTKHFRRIANY